MGPRTNSWETPQERGEGAVLLPVMETHWVQSVRYNLNCIRAGPETLRHCSMLSKRIWCDTKLKAAEQSNNLSRTGLQSSRALEIYVRS